MNNTTPHVTVPQGAFPVHRRLLRGYGPLAVLALLLAAVAVLVPSRAPAQQVTATAASPTPGAVSSAFDAAAMPAGGDGTAPVAGATPVAAAGGNSGGGGQTGAPGAIGAGGPATTVPGAATPAPIASTGGPAPCPDRAEQVPGDPYSPPCLTFSGPNGGATASGVTETTVRVSYRELGEAGFQQTLAELAGASLSDTPETVRNTVDALAEYFSTRFEFYGRDIEIVFYEGQGSSTNELLGKGRDRAEADAVEVAEELVTFADLSAVTEPYADALARRGIVGFGTPYLSRQWHEQRAPFAWSLATDGTLVSELASEYANRRLHGKPAAFAGGDLTGQPRKFATIAPENSWYQESVNNSRRITEEAGNDPGINVKYQLDLATMSSQANNIIPKLKSEGVTTIVCGCDPILPVFLSGVANREQYYPEFIIAGTALTDADIVGQLWEPAFARHAFGISSLNEFQPPQNTIAYAAFKSVRPDSEPAFSVDLIYYQMYMLAIGIQGAGPNLTPQSLEAGLFGYPQRSGPVGLWKFGPGDRTAANDVREIWFDVEGTSPYNGKSGTYRGTNGQRWESGQIPAGDPGIPAR